MSILATAAKLPAASGTGHLAAAWPGRQRGGDGRACGPLLVLGGCLAALDNSDQVTFSETHGTVEAAGRCPRVPGDGFRLAVVRRPGCQTFELWVWVQDGPVHAVPVRSGFLGRRVGWQCRG
jgi:hypothetical protein